MSDLDPQLQAALANQAVVASMSSGFASTAFVTGYVASALTPYALSSALSDYQTVAAMSAYATTASLSAYQTVAGMSAYATTAALALKAPLASPTFTGTVSGITKAMVGLGNVDNTSDASKPISTAVQAALDLKANIGGSGTNSLVYPVQALTSSPVDAQTIYFGNLPKAPVTVAATSKVYIRKAGTIKFAEIYCFSGTAGTAEAWSLYIRKNNTTDTLIATVSAATQERVFTNSALSIAVAAGDFIEIKAVNPTWATNPLTTIFGGYLIVE